MNVGLYRQHLSEFNKSQEHLTSGNIKVPEFLKKNNGTLKFDQITGGEVWFIHDDPRGVS